MKQINYALPIFTYSIGTKGLSRGTVENLKEQLIEDYEGLNMNIVFVTNPGSEENTFMCIWEGNAHNAVNAEEIFT